MSIDPTEHLRLVHFWAAKYCLRPDDHDDVASMGMLGLLKACRLFDPGRGVAVSTFASLLIKQAIIRELKRTQPLIRVPENWPMDRRIPVTSLDRPLRGGGDDDTALGHVIPDADAEKAPVDNIDAQDTRERVRAALGRLPRRDRLVLELRYGIRADDAAGHPLTLAEIGAVLRVTRERVRQLQLRAEARLARRLAG